MQISVQEAAARLNISDRRVRTLISERRIKAIQIAGVWVVTGIPAAVLDRRPGRPPKPQARRG